METMRTIILMIAVIFLVNTSSGQKFQLALAAPLAQHHEELSVKGRNGILIRQKLSFGKYSTVRVKRGLIRSWEGVSGLPGLIWTTEMEGRQSIQFRLTDSTDTSEVLMVTKISRKDLKIGSDPNSLPNQVFPILTIGNDEYQKNNLSTAIYLKKDDAPWELYLDNTAAQLNREDYTGYIYRGDVYYRIVPVWDIIHKGKIRQIPFGAAGFEIQNDKGEALAAVSLMDSKGIVYLGDLPRQERFLLANACAALLLQSNIDG